VQRKIERTIGRGNGEEEQGLKESPRDRGSRLPEKVHNAGLDHGGRTSDRGAFEKQPVLLVDRGHLSDELFEPGKERLILRSTARGHQFGQLGAGQLSLRELDQGTDLTHEPQAGLLQHLDLQTQGFLLLHLLAQRHEIPLNQQPFLLPEKVQGPLVTIHLLAEDLGQIIEQFLIHD
jgi:hypothetical protein